MTCLRCLRSLGASALLALAGCFPHATSTTSAAPASPSPQTAASPTPGPTSAALSTAPVFIISSSSAHPVPIVTPPGEIVSVAPAKNHKGAIAYRPPVTGPQILKINISSVVIHSGETVRGNVTTTSNVSNVDVHISAWAMPLAHPRPGYFDASGVIPQLPFFVKGNYTLQVIARTPGGQRVERDIPISIR